jgi:hypothetical protein
MIAEDRKMKDKYGISYSSQFVIISLKVLMWQEPLATIQEDVSFHNLDELENRDCLSYGEEIAVLQ